MDNMTAHGVSLHGIRKSFGPKSVIDDLSLEVDAGEFLVLLGPSGCGKSTLLALIAGLEEPAAGRVCIGPRDVTALEPGRREVAMVFQSFALYPTMSVRRNIGFALRMNGVPAAETAAKVASMARLLQIEDLVDRRPAQLSGGQQQRVAIGRALVREPAVLLLDEPLSNLDAKLRADMREELKKLHEKTRMTIVYVTHDQMEAMTLGTRVAVLNEGRIHQCDPPAVIYQQPANLFVASFVGSPAMRFLHGVINYAGETAALHTAGGCTLPLPDLPSFAAALHGQAVVLGVRPEHLHLVRSGHKQAAVGRVLRSEHTGPDIYLQISLGGHEVISRVTPGSAARSGDEVAVRVDGGAVSLFRPQDGKRLAESKRTPVPLRVIEGTQERGTTLSDELHQKNG
jgi:multiple sugar transport system ATP-binding protein